MSVLSIAFLTGLLIGQMGLELVAENATDWINDWYEWRTFDVRPVADGSPAQILAFEATRGMAPIDQYDYLCQVPETAKVASR